jgi:hypothetical protein
MELADRYEGWLCGDRIRESAPLQVARKIPELELQARWFAGEFGSEFTSTAGESVSVLEFGVWNREPGSAVSGALVSFHGEQPVRGAVAITTQRGDWGCLNPGSKRVVLHFFANGTTNRLNPQAAEGEETAQVRLDISRIEFVRGDPVLDKSLCPSPLTLIPEPQVKQLLEAAAQYRLCRKAARLQHRPASPGEVLYQALAETLGYRHNKLPFIVLAQRFPLACLRSQREAIEPLLFGGAGFLSATDLGSLAGDTRSYLRDLWGQWWPHRTEYEGILLPAALWKLGRVRPVNHPHRRVAALVEIVRNWPIIETLALRCDVAAIQGFFAQLQSAYWDYHYTLSSQRSGTRMALVGETRVNEMLANVFFPIAIGQTRQEPPFWEAYRKLPALDSNQRVTFASQRLFGSAPASKTLLKQAIFQQGLIQLYEDHCMDCTDCGGCALRERVERWL